MQVNATYAAYVKSGVEQGKEERCNQKEKPAGGELQTPIWSSSEMHCVVIKLSQCHKFIIATLLECPRAKFNHLL